MASVLFSRKAFLYFGGAAIILIGGAIVLMSPYHYINFAVIENDRRTFDIWEQDGYYPQLEIAVSFRPGNSTTIDIGFVFEENTTHTTYVFNMTLNQDNLVGPPDELIYESSIIVNIPYGEYTVTVDQINGAGMIDLGLNQISDSRLWITVGASMNVLGLIMGIAGYMTPGHFLPTDTDTIVEWGYEDGEEEGYNQGN